MTGSIFQTSLLLTLLVAASAHSIHAQAPIKSVTSAQWSALNKQVGGRLIAGAPYAKPCFPVVNATACPPVQQHYLDGTVRYNGPGGMIEPNWETCQLTGEQCLLDFTNPANPVATSPPFTCQMGSVSPYYVNVVAAYQFSESTGVPLVIHNSGHDYKGRSSAPDSLGLWTHNLQAISYNPSFVPDGCQNSASKPGVTLGAGVQFLDAYKFADANNITIVGGSDKGVGAAGGWLQGGGHGLLSNTMGLGVDRSLQFKIVTPDGQLRTANKCQNQDLFFALRGGGGGTFGVVLEATVLASPQVTIQATVVHWDVFNASLTEELWGLLIDNAQTIADNGYGFIAVESAVVFMSPTVSASSAVDIMKPFTEFGNKILSLNITGAISASLTYLSFLPAFEQLVLPNPAPNGVNLALSSRLIPKSSFTTASSRSAILSALIHANNVSHGVLVLATAPANFADDGQTSVTPAWRDTLWHVPLVVPWNFDSTLAVRQAAFAAAEEAITPLRQITPDAAYQNEASVHEPNHEVTFWGNNYSKLLSIKKKYDPKGLLNCWQCIGWQQNSSIFRCYI